jgi:hypothetical protein
MLLVVQIHPAALRAVSAPLSRLHLRAALPPFSQAISLTQFDFPSFWGRRRGLFENGAEFAAELLNLLRKNSQRSKESGFWECVLRSFSQHAQIKLLRGGIQGVARYCRLCLASIATHRAQIYPIL